MKALGLTALALLGGLLPAIAQAQISGDVVKVGVLNDQSGPYADFGGPSSVEAARMAVEDFGGTVAGKKIEVVFADHQNKADIGSAVARQWFETDGVDVAVDLTNSAVALAVQQLAKEKNRVALFSGPATARLSGDSCSPTGIHWTFDTYSQAVGAARAVVRQGGDSWFVLTVDYAFGHSMEADILREVGRSGGKIVGSVRHPLNNADFSSFILQAQASKAKVVALASAGADTTNAIKQAAEFGLTQGGQSLVGLVMVLSDIHALGLKTAQGLMFTTAFYWDRDDETRAWSKRFFERTKRMPGMVQAGVYSSVLHYLKAVQAAGTDEAKAVVAKMREIPVNDVFAKGGKVREDGRMVHDMYLVRVKKPEESKGPWDYYQILQTIKGEDAFRPLAESDCPLSKRAAN